MDTLMVHEWDWASGAWRRKVGIVRNNGMATKVAQSTDRLQGLG
jgi:hypothetical protein